MKQILNFFVIITCLISNIECQTCEKRRVKCSGYDFIHNIEIYEKKAPVKCRTKYDNGIVFPSSVFLKSQFSSRKYNLLFCNDTTAIYTGCSKKRWEYGLDSDTLITTRGKMVEVFRETKDYDVLMSQMLLRIYQNTDSSLLLSIYWIYRSSKKSSEPIELNIMRLKKTEINQRTLDSCDNAVFEVTLKDDRINSFNLVKSNGSIILNSKNFYESGFGIFSNETKIGKLFWADVFTWMLLLKR